MVAVSQAVEYEKRDAAMGRCMRIVASVMSRPEEKAEQQKRC